MRNNYMSSAVEWNSQFKYGAISVIIAGFILRLIAAWNSLYLVRADEVQYWEMAHRFVYGDGCISWEYKVGLRNWLNIWPNIIPLYSLKIIGITQPAFYIPIVKSFYALISLTIPLGMWKLAKELYDEKTAFIALVLGSFWYELILSSSHGLTEYYSVYCAFGALYFLGGALGYIQTLFMGILLGLGIAFRIHNFIPISAIGIFLILRFNYRQNITLFLGGITSILAASCIDYIEFGKFAGSYILYISSVFSLNKLDGISNPNWQHLFNISLCTGGLFYLVIGYGLCNYGKHLLALIAILGTLGFFSIQGVQEYSYISMITPFMLCILAELIAKVSSVVLKTGISIAIAAISFSGYLGAFSTWYLFKENGHGYQRQQGAFFKDPWLETALTLSKMPPGSVLWAIGDAVATGGYYVFHHHNQMFFPNGVPSHAALINGQDVHDFIRYIVAPVQLNDIAGFHPIKEWGGFCIYENDRVPAKQEVLGYNYEFQLPLEKSIFDLLLQHGLIKSIPPLTLWR